MEWWWILLLIFSGLMFLLLLGVPVAIAFLGVNIVCVYIFWGGEMGLRQLTLSIFNSINKFSLLPLPLFILMGEIMFHSGVAPKMMSTLDKTLGRLPGRLSLLAVGGGTIFGTLSGSSMAGAAVLGSVLIPEMEKHGYKKQMSIGPILGSGGLALMIPPSALGVLLAAIARFSIGDFLIAIIIPGLVMALLYMLYIIGRCLIQPELAPVYEVDKISIGLKIKLFLCYVFPLGGVVFLVIGLIFLGVATPTESAALGTAGCFILAFIFKGFDWRMVWKSVLDSAKVSVMMFMILTGSTAFSQILGFTGAAEGLVSLATTLDLSPMALVALMQLVLLIMGTFMEPLSILMLTIPIFLPIISNLGFSPIWFGVLMLLNMEMANTTPPFGLTLFVLKGVAPAGTTMKDVYFAGLPFLACDAVVMALIIAFPQVVLWLPSLMR
jgi:tripartite ATP-independent transporter DctM subunit